MINEAQLSNISAYNSLITSLSLEEEFEFAIFQDVDIKTENHFDICLEPNELFPTAVKPHLDLMEKGIIVSTGTERSFFDLLFADEKRCEGLVIVDITPKIKAYNDFNTLLLRIAVNRRDYFNLSSSLDEYTNLNKRIIQIRSRILAEF
ncbi:MAG: hypothetical protein H0V82_11115 [Candidatus Protochlamydia sp.]|nr:hypothetical protein [Candidatus Protochlamydia sp.]